MRLDEICDWAYDTRRKTADYQLLAVPLVVGCVGVVVRLSFEAMKRFASICR